MIQFKIEVAESGTLQYRFFMAVPDDDNCLTPGAYLGVTVLPILSGFVEKHEGEITTSTIDISISRWEGPL